MGTTEGGEGGESGGGGGCGHALSKLSKHVGNASQVRVLVRAVRAKCQPRVGTSEGGEGGGGGESGGGGVGGVGTHWQPLNTLFNARQVRTVGR